MLDATVTETLTLQAAGTTWTFPSTKTASIGAHRYCDVALDDSDGTLPRRAAVITFDEGGWALANVCDRHLVLHADGHSPLSLAPGGSAALTGAPFVLSVPGKASAAEVLVCPEPAVGAAPGASPWLLLTPGTPAPLLAPTAGRAASPPRARRQPSAIVLFVAVAVLLATGAAAAVQRQAHTAAPSRPAHPAAWDPRVADLVAFVEHDRQLAFKEPVFIDFTAVDAFKDEMGSGGGDLDEEGEAEMAQALGLLRATGLLEGDVDLAAQFSKLDEESVLAYYDYTTERIRVRGTELTQSLRATLVHELTHVLQDQHFDLGRLEHDDEEWLRSVAEGDAERVKYHWVDGLSPADAGRYEAELAAEGEGADLSGVPAVFLTVMGAPYTFGNGLVEALAATGGNPAVDRALQSPPTSDEQLLDPFRYLAGDAPQDVEQPALKPGEKRTDESTFGSLALYFMLAQRIDFQQAFRAADGWGGDAEVDFVRDGRACTRVAFRGDGPDDTEEIAAALDAWARSMPPGTASATRAAGQVLFESCDPGAGFKMGAPRLDEAQSLPLIRAGMAIGLIDGGIVPAQARCMAGKIIDQLDDATLRSDTKLQSSVKRRLPRAQAACEGSTLVGS